jgi:hypothetical protein
MLVRGRMPTEFVCSALEQAGLEQAISALGKIRFDAQHGFPLGAYSLECLLRRRVSNEPFGYREIVASKIVRLT